MDYKRISQINIICEIHNTLMIYNKYESVGYMTQETLKNDQK